MSGNKERPRDGRPRENSFDIFDVESPCDVCDGWDCSKEVKAAGGIGCEHEV